MASYRFPKGDKKTLLQEFVSYTNRNGAKKGNQTLFVALEKSTKLGAFLKRVIAIKEMQVLVNGSYDTRETTRTRKTLSRHLPVVAGTDSQLYRLEGTDPLSYSAVNASLWDSSLFTGPVQEAYVLGKYPARLYVAGNCSRGKKGQITSEEISQAAKAITRALTAEDLYLFGPDGVANNARKNFPSVYRVSDLKRITLG